MRKIVVTFLCIVLVGFVSSCKVDSSVYTYYGNNLADTETDSAGRYSKNYYDKNGNVIKIETLRQTGIVDVEKYEYDIMNLHINKDGEYIWEPT
jgi:hypothetical protein